MIALVAGTLALKEPDRVVVRTASGLGYEVFVPTRALEALPRPGQPVELHTCLVIREDGQTLFGFANAEERRVFQRLMTASGVGPRLALAMLSVLPSERIVRAIRERDIAVLVSVPGVGKKTAERLIVELGDKTDDLVAEAGTPATSVSEAAARALQQLGYTAAEADEAVRRTLAEDATLPTAALVKRALARLARS
ncbi:MAG: Holliday junction branch migration protein RuvA [Gemmatimonadales bacterium]|jgi:Holliday junction DNA helicase RuvA